MASAKPFRFSWQAYDAKSAADWRGKAQAAEAEGFSAFHLADHYLGPGAAADASHPPQILAAEAMGRELGMDRETFLSFPHALVGSIDYMCEELERRRELYGFSYVSVLDRCVDGLAPVAARLAGS